MSNVFVSAPLATSTTKSFPDSELARSQRPSFVIAEENGILGREIDRTTALVAGPGNAPHRGHRYCNQRGRPVDLPPENCVLFRNHKRGPLAPCQLRIELFVVDLASGAVAKTFDTPDVPVLPTPGEFALSSDATHAYVSCPQGGTIEILNLKDWKLEEPIRLSKGVDGMAWVPSATN